MTDTTSTIPEELLEGRNITLASQVVIWDGKTYRDRVEIQADEFYERLVKSSELPSTSQVSVADFKEIFERLHAEGFDILCVLISSKLSGTIASAEQAHQLVPEANVEIVDSLSSGMALGFQALAAADAAAAGMDLAACKAVAEQNVARSGVILSPDTLEYLHRGGRIGGASRLLGAALNIKPILEVQDGRIEPLERVRTRRKCLKRLVDVIEARIDGRSPVKVATLHANCLDEARMLSDMVAQRLSPAENLITEVSPAIGVHTGPGTIGLAFMVTE